MPLGIFSLRECSLVFAYPLSASARLPPSFLPQRGQHPLDVGAGECQSHPGCSPGLHFDVAISIGHPLHSREQPHAPKANGRKPFDEVVFWERWGGWMDNLAKTTLL